MLKSILLQNYRSHEDTLIQLHPHVNVIVGQGQAGKSNIMRAFETLRTNRPIGTKYRSWFAGDGDTTIQVETGEGTVVTFIKNGDGARYVVDGEEYRKVGTKVPDQVTAALNMGDLNLQWQHDSHYLIGGSAAQIGRAINNVIDFEELDKWIADINSRKSAVHTRKTVVKQQLEDAKKELATMGGVRKAGDILAEAEMLEQTIIGQTKRSYVLAELLAKAQEHKATLNRCDAALAAEDYIQRAEELQAEINHMAEGLALFEEAVHYNELLTRLDRRKYMVKQKYINQIKTLGVCPTCFGPADDETINRLKEEL